MKFDLEQCIDILTRTPDVLNSQLNGLTNEWIHRNEGGDSWSPYDVVGHLIHGEKTDWIPRARIILSNSEDRRFIPFDRFAQQDNDLGESLEELLDEFARIRRDNIAELRGFNIKPEHLSLQGIHPEFGVVSLEELIATWAAHDLSHINQITRVLMKNFKPHMGPWPQYFSLLKEE